MIATTPYYDEYLFLRDDTQDTEIVCVHVGKALDVYFLNGCYDYHICWDEES